MKINAPRYLILKLLLVCSLVLVSICGVSLAPIAHASPYLATTYIVTNTADSGPGSLRAAMESANAHPGADAIVFEVVGVIRLASPLPVISEDLSIDGNGHLIDIYGDGTSRIFEAPAGVTWQITYLLLIDGYASFGGAILNEGALEIRNCPFLSNEGAFGGAIYNTGDLAITDGSFAGNTTNGGQGGAIYNTGTLDIRNGDFQTNGDASEGGAIYNTGSASVNGVIFRNNRAGFEGGAIYNLGHLEIQDSLFESNVGGDDFGGAVSNQHGDLLVTNTRFINNFVNNAGGAVENTGTMQIVGGFFFRNSSKWGGAVHNGPTSSATIIETTFEENIGGHYGGAILNSGELRVESSTLKSNTGYDQGGGGIYNNGSAQVLNSTFSDNYANYVSTYSVGAAILNSGSMSVAYSTFADNRLDDPAGSAIANFGSLEIERSVIARTQTGMNCSGSLSASGPNMSDDDSCSGFIVADPVLGPLAINGGPTRTHALLFGSPAVDIAQDPDCPPVDQRGEPRPVGPGCDLGAFEMGDVFVLLNIRPKGGSFNTIDLRSVDTIPVAILSQPGFDAPSVVDRNSLTFGATGYENSLHRIPRSGKLSCSVNDMDGDGLPDLVCMFDLPAAGFTCGDTHGYLRGVLFNTQRLVGSDSVRVIPCP